MITYSTSSPVMPAFCRAAEMAIPPRSTAGMSLREPDNLPIGVLAPPTMTDPGIVRLLLSFRPVKIRDRRVHVVPHQIPPRRSRAAVAGRQHRHPHHRLVGKCRTAARIALDVERGCWSSPVRRGPTRQPIADLCYSVGHVCGKSCLRHRWSDPMVARRDRQHGCGSRVQPSQPGEDDEMRSSRASVVQSTIFERRPGSRLAAESLPHFAYHNARSIICIDQSLVYRKGLIMDLQENMRAANQRTLEWVTSMHESILDATKSYVASFAKSAPEPPTWTEPQVASAPDLKQLIEDSYDFQARMLEENKKFSLALADAWAAAAPSKSAE